MIHKISVVIPAYNEEKSIKECLVSLQNQSLLPDEIIVVDDGSTDKTVKIVKSLPVKLILAKHGGPGNARNLGVSKAIGDIIVFVDSDMTFDKNFIRTLTGSIVDGKTKGVFNTDEFVSNYQHPLAKSWNINNGIYSKNRFNPKSKEDTEDFRAILKSEFLRAGGFEDTGYTDSRTLVAKLGYRPTPVEGAISYHSNPDNFTEIFNQSKWIGKRQTKFGILGKVINLVRHSILFSLIRGSFLALKFHLPEFLFFKIVYDFGYSMGIVSSVIYSSKWK